MLTCRNWVELLYIKMFTCRDRLNIKCWPVGIGSSLGRVCVSDTKWNVPRKRGLGDLSRPQILSGGGGSAPPKSGQALLKCCNSGYKIGSRFQNFPGIGSPDSLKMLSLITYVTVCQCFLPLSVFKSFYFKNGKRKPWYSYNTLLTLKYPSICINGKLKSRLKFAI